MRSFIKTFFIAILLTGSVYSYAKTHTLVKHIVSKVEDRHLSGFNAVDLVGSFDVYITQGSTESVKVEAPDNIIDHIITEVKGGVLKIYNKNEKGFRWDEGNHEKIAVYVTAKDINSIALTGSGDIFFKEGLHTNSLKLSISGSGDMTGKVDVKTLESSIAGSGDIKLSGRADSSTIRVVGSGDFSGRELITVNTNVRVSGSGDASVNASNKVDALLSGSGNIHYTGGASVSSSKTGSGDIKRD